LPASACGACLAWLFRVCSFRTTVQIYSFDGGRLSFGIRFEQRVLRRGFPYTGRIAADRFQTLFGIAGVAFKRVVFGICVA
jgi:hypothetical protein